MVILLDDPVEQYKIRNVAGSYDSKISKKVSLIGLEMIQHVIMLRFISFLKKLLVQLIRQ